MIFGIYGAYATGKTTFVRSVIPESDMVRVFGDVRGIEDEVDPSMSRFTTSKSVRVMDSKIELIQYAAADREKLWVIEGCRFWGGVCWVGQELLLIIIRVGCSSSSLPQPVN